MSIDLAPALPAGSPEKLTMPPASVRQVEKPASIPGIITLPPDAKWSDLRLAALSPGASTAAADADPLKNAFRTGLAGKDFTERYEAVRYAFENGTKEERSASVPVLLELLGDARSYATDKDGMRMGSFLERCLYAAEPEMKEKAVLALKAQLGASAGEAVQLAALRGLVQLGDTAKPALPECQAIIGSKWNVQYGRLAGYAMQVVANVDPAKGLELAAKGMSDANAPLRIMALRIVAKCAVPEQGGKFLLKARQIYGSDKILEARIAAGGVLHKLMGNEQACSLFAGDIAKGEPLAKQAGLRLLGFCGTRGLEVIRKYIDQPDYYNACLAALIRIGPDARPLLPEVEYLRKSPNQEARSLAETAYKAITKPNTGN